MISYLLDNCKQKHIDFGVSIDEFLQTPMLDLHNTLRDDYSPSLIVSARDCALCLSAKAHTGNSGDPMIPVDPGVV